MGKNFGRVPAATCEMSRLHEPSLPANPFVYRETPPKQKLVKVGVYRQPEVHIHVTDGRSFVHNAKQQFDCRANDPGGHLGLHCGRRLCPERKQPNHNKSDSREGHKCRRTRSTSQEGPQYTVAAGRCPPGSAAPIAIQNRVETRFEHSFRLRRRVGILRYRKIKVFVLILIRGSALN